MADNKGVMIFTEIIDGKLAPIAKELLGAGRKLANDLKEELSALVVGSGVANVAAEAITFGADKVFVVDDPLLKDYRTDSYVAIVEKVVKQSNPRVFLMGQTTIGRDLAPRAAFRLGTAVTLDCVALEIDAASKLLLQTKPVYGGNARAIYTMDTLPQMATVRAKAMSALAPDAAKKGEVVTVAAGLDPAAIKTNVLQKVVAEVQGIKLEDASIIVSGGRGIGGPEGFKQLEELAKILKGAVGASRPPCDNGWVPETIQVGLTGKIVSPETYIAVAISGSSQHLAGCSGSKNIIAINRDAEANIFKEARFGVVGDWKKVIPAFQAKIKELLGK
ncbi:MAG: electron transfer flavoprotein subunit alpha/FixB family protein [Dehalococcoidales bacterium]|nr:electron transfer flavoprotein subunit alpha/FixB family protein [Dehalococcoidales bacterium]